MIYPLPFRVLWTAPSLGPPGLRSGRALSRGGPTRAAVGVSARLGRDRSCNPIGAVKRPVFSFSLSRFFVRSEDRFFAPTIRRCGTCAEAGSRLVAASGHPKGLALMAPSKVQR